MLNTIHIIFYLFFELFNIIVYLKAAVHWAELLKKLTEKTSLGI